MCSSEFDSNFENKADLSLQCFLSGRSLGPHKAHHAYRIISSHSFPIFSADWGADEELLLIEGAETYGLGNWADMAEYVGGRTKEECEKHYEEIYLRSKEYPLPVSRLFSVRVSLTVSVISGYKY